jgi:hypothetical protein
MSTTHAIPLEELVERYVGIWNEPDPATRRAAIPHLWTENGINVTSSLEARGYPALAARIARAHDQYVAAGEHLFRSSGEVQAHHGAARLRWEMVRTVSGEVAASGCEFFILADDGRIDADYQFPEP